MVETIWLHRQNEVVLAPVPSWGEMELCGFPIHDDRKVDQWVGYGQQILNRG